MLGPQKSSPFSASTFEVWKLLQFGHLVVKIDMFQKSIWQLGFQNRSWIFFDALCVHKRYCTAEMRDKNCLGSIEPWSKHLYLTQSKRSLKLFLVAKIDTLGLWEVRWISLPILECFQNRSCQNRNSWQKRCCQNRMSTVILDPADLDESWDVTITNHISRSVFAYCQHLFYFMLLFRLSVTFCRDVFWKYVSQKALKYSCSVRIYQRTSSTVSSFLQTSTVASVKITVEITIKLHGFRRFARSKAESSSTVAWANWCLGEFSFAIG